MGQREFIDLKVRYDTEPLSRLSPAVESEGANKIHGKQLDPSARPYAIFHLKYRSKGKHFESSRG
jgi:hypothetical protein